MSEPGFDLGALLDGVNLQSMMSQVQQLQEELQQAQQELAETEFTADAGGGLVTVTVLGTGELVGLTITPQVCDPDDTDTLADLIVAAYRKAYQQASEAMQQKMPQLPGTGIAGS